MRLQKPSTSTSTSTSNVNVNVYVYVLVYVLVDVLVLVDGFYALPTGTKSSREETPIGLQQIG
jgi:hypothetical protein